MLNIFRLKNPAIYKTMWKKKIWYSRTDHRWQYNAAHAHCITTTIIIIIIIIIYCNWVVTRWQWLFYMYTKYEIGMLDNYAYTYIHTYTHTHTHTHTLRMCNTYSFSIATMVARTRLDVTLHVHSLSCCNWPNRLQSTVTTLQSLWLHQGRSSPRDYHLFTAFK